MLVYWLQNAGGRSRTGHVDMGNGTKAQRRKARNFLKTCEGGPVLLRCEDDPKMNDSDSEPRKVV